MKILELPLFAGYVFARLSCAQLSSVLLTPGVRYVVSFDGKPAPVSDEEIQNLQLMMRSGVPLEPWPFLKEGDLVRVERGPLRGVEGVLVRLKGSWRVVISVRVLERSVAAEVDREDVIRCSKAR